MLLQGAREYEFYNSNAGDRFAELSRSGMKAVFIYSPNVYTNGRAVRYDPNDRNVRTIAISGEVFAPVSLFTDHLGASVEIVGDNATLSLGGASADFRICQSKGVACLPVIRCAQALGLSAKGYYEGRLVVIGTPADISAMDDDADMQTAGAYMIFGKYDPYSFTSDDYKAAREKWKIKLVGSPELNDMSNDLVREKIEALDRAAEEKWATMHKEPDRFILWGDAPPVESFELGRQYGGLRVLARAWATYGCKMYQNEEIRLAVMDGVEWMYEHMYGVAEMEERGWRSAHAFNWYEWFVSAPDYLCDIFYCFEDCYTVEDRRKYLECFEWCSTFMRHWFKRDAALSRIWTGTKVGIACEDPDWLYGEYVDFDMLLGLGETEEGPRVDYVQWTHGMPYNNHYGVLNLDRVLYVASTLAGTPVEFLNPKQYNQFMLIKYMYEAAMHKGQAFVMFCGRYTDILESHEGGAIVGHAMQMYGMFGEDEDTYLAKFLKRSTDGNPISVSTIKNIVSIETSRIVDSILKDDNLQVDDYEYAHAWFTGDRAAQHRNNYAIGIAMSSKREPAWECINSANKTGWYTGDGATYLYTDYDRNQFDGANFLTKNIEVAYRIPGTTEDSRERVARSIKSNLRGTKSYAGSMQIEDKYILAAMDFESYNYEGPDENPDDSDYGGSPPPHKNDLRAKKAWFCFDDEIVCLGAGINSTMDSPVHTTVEHKRIVTDELGIFLDGEGRMPAESFEKLDTGAKWVLMDGHSGYAFPWGGEVYARRYTCEAANGQDFFELGLEHGKNPTDATYAYAIMPYASLEKLDTYVKNPDVEILANTSRVQAVVEKTLDIRCYAFHEAADLAGVMVDAPCLVTMTHNTLSVSDPTRELEKLTVTVWSSLEITEKAPNMQVLHRGGKTIITLDLTGANGRRFDLKFIPFAKDMKYKVRYDQNDEAKFLELSHTGAVAAFAYCNRVMKDGVSQPMGEGERAVFKNDVLCLPVSFFERFLGTHVASGEAYVPAVSTAHECGFAAETFYEGRLVVIGTPEHIEAIKKNPLLEEAGAYAVFGKYDASVFTSEDYEKARYEWKLRLVGSPEINDLADKTILGKIGFIDNNCRAAMAEMNRGDDRVILWGDKAPVETDDLGRQYYKLEHMARAWGTYGSEFYQSDEVLALILEAMEWLYENMYGEAEIAGTGWRDVRLFNWWYWFVGAPDSLTNVMLILGDILTLEQKQKYLKCYKWVRTIMYPDPKGPGAASRILVGTKAAILLEDVGLLEQAQLDCDITMRFDEYGAVHRADYLDWTHSLPHNISYGAIHLQRSMFVAATLASTPLAFDGPQRYNQFNLIRYTFDPSIYRAQGFVMFSGRSTFARELNQGAAILAAALPMIGVYGEDEDMYVKRFIKRNACTPEIVDMIKAHASIYECAKLKAILDDPAVDGGNDGYECAHAWFTGDRAAQHRNNYAIGLALSSEREHMYECINSANKTGWYTGDGATYLYTTYDGHQFDGDNFITKNINVAYRFPGTTEDSRERVARSISSQYGWYPENSFSGSMKIEDKYIVAAMDFVSLNYEGPDIKPDDYGYGGSQPIHKNDLRAKKAWFCFDGEIVCLGAGITSTMDSPVHTTVEHKRIVTDELGIYLDGEGRLPAESFEKLDTGATFALMEGHCGYVFPSGKGVYVRRYTCESANNQDFIEIGIDHGKNPADATYEYVLIPYAGTKKLDTYAKNPDVAVLSNTKKVQAVRENGLGITAYVFHEAGECEGISVDAPCIVALSKCCGECTLAITDPTHKCDKITVTLGGGIKVIGASDKITVGENCGNTVVAVNTFMAHGRKFEMKYEER